MPKTIHVMLNATIINIAKISSSLTWQMFFQCYFWYEDVGFYWWRREGRAGSIRGYFTAVGAIAKLFILIPITKFRCVQ